MVRKGFLHAIDAVIGCLLLLMFLTVIFPNPQEKDWTTLHMQKEAEDLLSSLGNTKVLGNVVVSKNLDTLDVLFSTLAQNTGYYATISGIPKRSIKIGNILGEKDIIQADTVYGEWDNCTLPDSENSYYRRGEIFGVKFILYDTTEDLTENYDSVNFDFNNDSDFVDAFEGSYEFNSVFECQKKGTLPSNSSCNGNYYEIAPLTDKLILYNATYSKELGENIDSIVGPYFSSYFTIDNLNFNSEGLSDQDILLIWKVPLNELNSQIPTISTFLKSGKSIIEIKNLNNSQMQEPIQKLFNFTHINKTIIGLGDTENIFVTTDNPSNLEYFVSKYFYQTPISITNFQSDFTLGSELLYKSGWNVTNITSEDDLYLTKTVNLGGNNYNMLLANDSGICNKSYFSENSVFLDTTLKVVGDTIKLGKNYYKIKTIDPFKLVPQKPYYFTDYFVNNVTGDYGILKRKNYLYSSAEDHNVYTINANTRVINGSGTVVQIPEKTVYKEDYNLIRAISLYLGTQEESLKKNLLSSEAVGVPYLGSFNGSMYLPYLLNTAWWYL